jgi:hypothetical protein
MLDIRIQSCVILKPSVHGRLPELASVPLYIYMYQKASESGDLVMISELCVSDSSYFFVNLM